MSAPLSERLEALIALRLDAPLHASADTEAEWLGEAAELARRVEGSILVEITESQQLPGTADYDYGDMIAAVMKFKPGARVALVEVE